MRRRIFFLLLIVLLFSGCEANYNANFDDSSAITQNVVISDDKSKEDIEKYLDNNLEYKDRLDTYNYAYITENNTTSLSLNNLTSFSNMNKEKSVKDFVNIQKFDADDGGYSLVINDFEHLFSVLGFEKITINIESKFIINSSNADSEEDNICKWTLTRDNYKNKEIWVGYTANLYGVNDANEGFMLSAYMMFALLLAIIVFVILMIRKILDLKSNSINKL
jgi:hypothetical protein